MSEEILDVLVLLQAHQDLLPSRRTRRL